MGFGNAAGSFMTGFMAGYKFIDDAEKKQQEINALKAKAEADLRIEKDKLINSENERYTKYIEESNKIDKESQDNALKVEDPKIALSIINNAYSSKEKLAENFNATSSSKFRLYYDTPMAQYIKPLVDFKSGAVVTIDSTDGTSSFMTSKNSTLGQMLIGDSLEKPEARVYSIDNKGLLFKKDILGTPIPVDSEGQFIKTGDEYTKQAKLQNINTAPHKNRDDKTNQYTKVDVKTLPQVVQKEIIKNFGDVATIPMDEVQTISKNIINSNMAVHATNEDKYIEARIHSLKIEIAQKTGKPIDSISDNDVRVLATREYKSFSSDMNTYVAAYLKEHPNATELEAMNAYKTLTQENASRIATFGGVVTNSFQGLSGFDVKKSIDNLPPKDKALVIKDATTSDIYKNHISKNSTMLSDLENSINKIDNITKASASGKLNLKGIVGTDALNILAQLPKTVTGLPAFTEANKEAINNILAQQDIASVIFKTMNLMKGSLSDKDMEMIAQVTSGIKNGNADSVTAALQNFKQQAINTVNAYYRDNSHILGITNSKDYERLEKINGNIRKSEIQNISFPTKEQATKIWNTLTPQDKEALKAGKTIGISGTNFEFFKTPSGNAGIRIKGAK